MGIVEIAAMRSSPLPSAFPTAKKSRSKPMMISVYDQWEVINAFERISAQIYRAIASPDIRRDAFLKQPSILSSPPLLKAKPVVNPPFARRESVISVNWNPKAGVLEIWRRREGGATSIDIPTDRFDIKLLSSGRDIYTDFTSEVFTISLRVGSVLGVATCTYFG